MIRLFTPASPSQFLMRAMMDSEFSLSWMFSFAVIFFITWIVLNLFVAVSTAQSSHRRPAAVLFRGLPLPRAMQIHPHWRGDFELARGA